VATAVVRPARAARARRTRGAGALILLLIATGGAFAAISSAASASPASFERRALRLAAELQPLAPAATVAGLRALLAELPPADASTGDADARRARVVVLGALVDAGALEGAVDDPDAALANAAALVAAGPFTDLAVWFELRSFQWRFERGRAGIAEGLAALRRIDALPAAARHPSWEGPLALLVVDCCLAEWR
jgi:hypothetical protein